MTGNGRQKTIVVNGRPTTTYANELTYAGAVLAAFGRIDGAHGAAAASMPDVSYTLPDGSAGTISPTQDECPPCYVASTGREGDMCVSCQQREPLHQLLAAARRREGGVRRRLLWRMNAVFGRRVEFSEDERLDARRVLGLDA